MNQVIVTGATGFIGCVFVEFLTSRGIEVLSIGRKHWSQLSKYKKDRLSGSSYLNLDMDSISSLSDLLVQVNWNMQENCTFFNLAWGGANGLSDLDVGAQFNNVVRSLDALNISAEIGCRRFIQVGTMEEAFTSKYLDLDYTVDCQYNRHVIYSLAKISAKQALQIRAEELGVDFIYVLHSHVMGPEDDKDSFLQVTLQKIINGVSEYDFSSGDQYFDVISVRDCALGYHLLCEKGKAGEEYWVGSGEPQRLRNYVDRMFALFPGKRNLRFGALPYNDIVLTPSDFSIEALVNHTGYFPTMTYEQTVYELHRHLLRKQ